MTSYGSGAGVSRVRPGSVTAVVYRPMNQLATRATMPQAMSTASRLIVSQLSAGCLKVALAVKRRGKRRVVERAVRGVVAAVRHHALDAVLRLVRRQLVTQDVCCYVRLHHIHTTCQHAYTTQMTHGPSCDIIEMLHLVCATLCRSCTVICVT